MKNSAILSLVLAIAAGIAGCGQRKEVAVTEADNDKAVEQEPKKEDRPRQEVPPKHGDHKHAFADPAERAKKWNDPERDRWQHPEEIVAALDLKPGATVADIGAGTGYMVAHLSKAVGKGGTVIAIDASAEMVEYLAKRSADLGPARVVPRKVGFGRPRATDRQRGRGVDSGHMAPRQGAGGIRQEGVRGAEAVGGGSWWWTTRSVRRSARRRRCGSTPRAVKKQLEAAGFRAEVVRESMPRHYVVVGHKDQVPLESRPTSSPGVQPNARRTW